MLSVQLYTLLKLNEFQFIAHIAQNCMKMLGIVHEILMVLLADEHVMPVLCQWATEYYIIIIAHVIMMSRY